MSSAQTLIPFFAFPLFVLQNAHIPVHFQKTTPPRTGDCLLFFSSYVFTVFLPISGAFFFSKFQAGFFSWPAPRLIPFSVPCNLRAVAFFLFFCPLALRLPSPRPRLFILSFFLIVLFFAILSLHFCLVPPLGTFFFFPSLSPFSSSFLNPRRVQSPCPFFHDIRKGDGFFFYPVSQANPVHLFPPSFIEAALLFGQDYVFATKARPRF